MIKTKKVLILTATVAIFVFLLLLTVTRSIYADDGSVNKSPQISAQAALIMEYDSGEILFEKNARQKLYPASTTKILTAITAIEEIRDYSEMVKISANAAGRNNSFFTLKYGDSISARDLLKAALISSHNNATIALAEFVSGSEAEFVKLMNRKALQIGANDSSFQNTNGLDSDSPEHKTTAMDLALIARYCMGNEIFKNIVSTDLDIINISGEPVDIFNTNVLLFFDYIKGIKTGFTNNAGYCLVLYSERQGLKLITVILNSSEGSRESDALNLINWANDNFTHKKIIDSDKEYKLIEISHQTKNDNYGLFSSLYSYVYPEEDFINLTNVDDEIVISDNLKQSVSPGDMVYLPLMPVDLPSGRNYVTGKLTATVNENLKKDVNLVLREDIDSVKITVALVKENNARVKYILIFLISFYFLIFILIIVRNLLKREKNK